MPSGNCPVEKVPFASQHQVLLGLVVVKQIHRYRQQRGRLKGQHAGLQCNALEMPEVKPKVRLKLHLVAGADRINQA